ncbi:MAG: acetyl-CoA carboxylase carboxyltransferase subunit alpha [Chrysiogenetes bacterium]|nr:acetyl-CoA carboxylase carboxyltransferase subunit alpha [Chrysiogenetes bacterium]
MNEAPTRKYLAFEIEVRPLDEKLVALKPGSAEHDAALTERDALLQKINDGLSPWERVQLARHPERPYTLDFIERLITEFEPLHGDRLFGEDPAIIGGLGRLGGRAVVVLGQQKGRTAEQRAHRNFGMARPEGYRKAQRLMEMAGRFQLPIVTFVDTPGAFPGLEAEERGQAQAIAESILKLLDTPVPSVSLVIGEGGSGGALALASTDTVLMAENAVYSVISPEGCAAILWKDAAQAPEAARALRGDAASLKEFGIVDELVTEPAGGAHRDPGAFMDSAGAAISACLDELCGLDQKALLTRRRARYRAMTQSAITEKN